MSYLFTSESVSEGHPDKVADQISDALIDNFLAWDPESKVACETLVTTGLVVLAGEVKTNTYLDVQKIAREVVEKAYRKFQPKTEEFEFFSPSVNFWEEDEMGCLLPNAILRQRTLVDKIYEGYKQIYGGVPTIVEY